MGSHSALSSVMTVSQSRADILQPNSLVNNRLPHRVAPGDTARMRISLAVLIWFALAGPLTAADDAAQMQRNLIDEQIARIPAAMDGRARVFFVGFAGYGEERVFAEEIKLAARRVGEKYGSTERSVLLINDRRDLVAYPFASASSLRYTLESLAKVTDLKTDVLFLALSSHGSPDATIEVSNTGMKGQTLSASTLAGILSASGFRWKVVVISACFSGRFVKPLADEHTIVITASARNRSSFGCSDTRELTYFGEAFYRDAMPDATDLRAAFDAARQEIRRRERDEKVRASHPQASFGDLMEAKLREIGEVRPAGNRSADQGR
jgi:hypothetical protein